MSSLWCSPADVSSRIKGEPEVGLITEYIEQATSILYILSGRRYTGEANVVAQHEIDRRGYVSLTAWLPVRSVSSATIGGQPVAFALSPAGTYVAVAQHLRGQIVVLDIAVGQNPPLAGKRACAALAAEMLRGDPRYAVLGADDIRPPMRLTSVTRQGVTYQYADPAELMKSDLTGVYEVDLFLRAVNPTGARFQPKVV